MRGGLAQVSYFVVIPILLLETLLRVSSLFPQPTPFFVSDPETGFRARAHVRIAGNTTNSFGFNDIEHEPTTKKHVAVIGDSFVFGVVERKHNFVSKLQEAAVREGVDVEMWNFGIPGSGPENYLGVMRKHAVSVKAELVCLVFFVGNDVSQSHPDFISRLWLGAPREILHSPYLAKFSLEYSFVHRLFRSGARLLWHKLAQTQGNDSQSFSRDTYLSIEHQRSGIYKIQQNTRDSESYEGAKAMLSQMYEQAKRNRMSFLVVLAPDELQVNSSLRQDLIATYSLNAGDYDFRKPQRILRGYLDAQGIQSIDLLPDLIEAQSDQPMYAPYDSHWNQAGNELAAKKIWPRIRKMLMGTRWLPVSDGLVRESRVGWNPG